jgi:ligand-binding sensor domain-containing protein
VFCSWAVKVQFKENGLPQNSVKSIVQDPQGNIWLAAESGLVRFDGRHFAVFRDFDGSFLDASMESFHINL